MSKVAFIGLGVMGYPMAGISSAKGGHETAVYNRTLGKAQAWVAEFGGNMAPTPEQAAREADLVFACVGNDDDLRSVATGVHGAFHGYEKGRHLHRQHDRVGLISPANFIAAAERGAHFLDAPVSGGQAGAQNGSLTVMAAATLSLSKGGARHFLYARAVNLIGPAGSGQLTKMVNQLCIAGLIQSLGGGHSFRSKGRARPGAGDRDNFEGSGADPGRWTTAG